MIRNDIGIDINDQNIIEAPIVKEIAIEKPPIQTILTKLFVIIFITSMLLGYAVPILRILNP